MMNDEIIAMALEAGAEYYAETILVNGKDARDFVEPFAALIEAKAKAEEREASALHIDCNIIRYGHEFAEAIRKRGDGMTSAETERRLAVDDSARRVRQECVLSVLRLADEHWIGEEEHDVLMEAVQRIRSGK